MNILFVNYGDFTTNSLNHIAGFANTLCADGHACVVAVPQGRETVSAVHHPLFQPATYDEVLARPGLFPDGRSADLIHAWTPREGVRKFVLAHQRLAPARLIVHLEDNEEHLISTFAGLPLAELREKTVGQYPFPLVDGLPHPVRYKHLLRIADGATVIVDRLKQFVPSGCPAHLLTPGVDLNFYRPRSANLALRAELGLRPDEKIIVYTGSVTFANEPEMRELYLAVKLINDRGVSTKLIRTGFTRPDFHRTFGFDVSQIALELGFVDKERLPQLLALADVLVQPGSPGPFNDYRLPSKVPEFLAVGKPLVLPASNIGLSLRPNEDAILLRTGAPAEIADACARLFSDPALAERLGRNAAAFARSHFDLLANTTGLVAFYRSVLDRAQNTASVVLSDSREAEVALIAGDLRQRFQSARPSETPDEFGAVLADLEDIVFSCRQLAADLGEEHKAVENLRQHIAGMERQLANYEPAMQRIRELEKVDFRRQQAEVLYHAARKQLQAMESELARSEAGRTLTARRYQSLKEDASRNYSRAIELTRETERLLQQEARLKRIHASFSWKVTSPLRALRRSFEGPAKKLKALLGLPDPEKITADPVNLSYSLSRDAFVAPPKPRFYAHIDSPRSWGETTGSVVVRGWCFTDEPIALKTVRARIGARLFDGAYGLDRRDVAGEFPDSPQTFHSGFKIEVTLQPGDEALELEISDEHGVWHGFLRQLLRRDATAAAKGTYAHWVQLHDTIDAKMLDALRVKAAALPTHPLISVLMPVYNAPEKWLARAIESARAQVYPHWELCIADDASTQPHIRPLLEKAAREDNRIKVVFREKNGHISAATNSALALATGDYAALFVHDDELAPHALYCVAAEIAAHPDAALIYSDEDNVDEYGFRFDPHFKPDWNPDLLLGQNYLSHLSVYRTALLREVGGLRVGFEGSQDWDLALRVTEKIDPKQIRHIPRVLYHWRALDGSTALQLDEKDYAGQAARRALAEHFLRIQKTVTLEMTRGGHWHARFPRPQPAPLVTLIIPTRNRRELLVACVESIFAKTAYPYFEILVADNESDDPELLAYYERTKARGRFDVLPCPGAFNFSAINNRAVQHARGEIVGLLNNDLEAIHPDWLDEMVSQSVRPEIGAVGAKLYYPDTRIQHAGVITGLGGVAGHAFKHFPRHEPGTPQFRPHLRQNLSAVTAACLVIRKSVFLQAGGFDENQLKVAFNDVDFCLKIESLGYRNLYTPFAEFVHHESASRGAENTPEKIVRFQKEIETMKQRWGDRLLVDPAYNPNFSLDTEDFALAYPPRVPAL